MSQLLPSFFWVSKMEIRSFTEVQLMISFVSWCCFWPELLLDSLDCFFLPAHHNQSRSFDQRRDSGNVSQAEAHKRYYNKRETERKEVDNIAWARERQRVGGKEKNRRCSSVKLLSAEAFFFQSVRISYGRAELASKISCNHHPLLFGWGGLFSGKRILGRGSGPDSPLTRSLTYRCRWEGVLISGRIVFGVIGWDRCSFCIKLSWLSLFSLDLDETYVEDALGWSHSWRAASSGVMRFFGSHLKGRRRWRFFWVQFMNKIQSTPSNRENELVFDQLKSDQKLYYFGTPCFSEASSPFLKFLNQLFPTPNLQLNL